jgi:hypothetical protein
MFFGSWRDSWRIWLVIGLGLCGYGYYERSRLHVPNDAELEQAVDAQYRNEIASLQRQAGEMPVELSPEWQEKFRTAIRSERLAPVEKAKKRVQSLFGAGLILLVLAAGMFVYQRQVEKQKP